MNRRQFSSTITLGGLGLVTIKLTGFSSFLKISSNEMRSPPVNVYSESHQTQRIGQPVRRTKLQGLPACEDSP
jgi:hypothetical protein